MLSLLQPYLAPVPTGPRGNILLNEFAALEQLLVRDDDAWSRWLSATYDPEESRGSVVDSLWKRVEAKAVELEATHRESKAALESLDPGGL